MGRHVGRKEAGAGPAPVLTLSWALAEASSPRKPSMVPTLPGLLTLRPALSTRLCLTQFPSQTLDQGAWLSF